MDRPLALPNPEDSRHAFKFRPAWCCQRSWWPGSPWTSPQGWRTRSWVPCSSLHVLLRPTQPWHSRLFLSPHQGIGNTFQGGANCIMFVFCTRVVRTRLLSLCCCCCSPQPPEAPAPSKRGESQRPRRTPNELPST